MATKSATRAALSAETASTGEAAAKTGATAGVAAAAAGGEGALSGFGARLGAGFGTGAAFRARGAAVAGFSRLARRTGFRGCDHGRRKSENTEPPLRGAANAWGAAGTVDSAATAPATRRQLRPNLFIARR
ncbi:hypothetical protein [Methylopila sp. Yamaguchi]|uniref:hypothetical protein n=1 Tax=Methylopila sp. Yamaguchi TaxID=1437817 RepID=UPI001AECA924|nr:hypothetical protein [Methylopila sp. Yamaguchi]